MQKRGEGGEHLYTGGARLQTHKLPQDTRRRQKISRQKRGRLITKRFKVFVVGGGGIRSNNRDRLTSSAAIFGDVARK